MTPGPLGRLEPPDWAHVEKWPLAALPAAQRPTSVPVVVGSNWYTAMDTPAQDSHGYWWVTTGDLGTVRGGHAYCLEPAPWQEHDLLHRWWQFYSQGREGACEGFAHARMQSLLLRQTFDGFWLYERAQMIDGTPLPHDGTTNRAALEVLRTEGLVLGSGPVAQDHGARQPADPKYRIRAYRWATTVEEILAALGTPGAGFVNILNSWGHDAPHRVRLPVEQLARLLAEGGEASVVTEA